MESIKYCPKCGFIDELGLYDKCEYCGTLCRDTEYDVYESLDKRGLIPEIEEAIKNEYVLKSPELSQEAIAERLEQEKYNRIHNMSTVSHNTISCPYCKSINVSKISTVSRAASVAMIGIASGKIGKQWHCNGCGSNF